MDLDVIAEYLTLGNVGIAAFGLISLALSITYA